MLSFPPAAQPERWFSHCRPTAQQVALFVAACAALRMWGLGLVNGSFYQTSRATQRQYGPDAFWCCPVSNVLDWASSRNGNGKHFLHSNLFLLNVGVNCSTLGSSTVVDDSPSDSEMRLMCRFALLLLATSLPFETRISIVLYSLSDIYYVLKKISAKCSFCCTNPQFFVIFKLVWKQYIFIKIRILAFSQL